MTSAEFANWLERYGQAWIKRDPEAAVQLFAPDARYYETPFDVPLVGRADIWQYWQHVPQSQESISFQATPLAIVNGACRRVKLDGVFLLQFDSQGLCVELREWWHRRELSTGSTSVERNHGNECWQRCATPRPNAVANAIG
jgi:SnoaL-like domain